MVWEEDGWDRWNRFDTEEDLLRELEEIRHNPKVYDDDIRIFPPEADEFLMSREEFMEKYFKALDDAEYD